jgi:hypothetical protein
MGVRHARRGLAAGTNEEHNARRGLAAGTNEEHKWKTGRGPHVGLG